MTYKVHNDRKAWYSSKSRQLADHIVLCIQEKDREEGEEEREGKEGERERETIKDCLQRHASSRKVLPSKGSTVFHVFKYISP